MRNCACGAALGPMSKTDSCRSCTMRARNADPVWAAKRVAGLLACDAMQPGSQTRREAARKGAITRNANPVYMAWLRENVRTVVQPRSRTPEAIAKRNPAAVGLKKSKAMRAWCPEGMWAEYQYLLRNKGMKMADAKRVIIAEHRRKIEALSPFERQMRALENGAKIVANDRKPMFGEALRA